MLRFATTWLRWSLYSVAVSLLSLVMHVLHMSKADVYAVGGITVLVQGRQLVGIFSMDFCNSSW